MKLIKFHYQIKASIEIKEREINRLFQVGERHFDQKCKSAVMSGGFLFRWRNLLEFNKITLKENAVPTENVVLQISANCNEIDTMAKIMAISHLVRHDEEIDLEFYNKLSKLLRDMSKETEKINNANTEKVPVNIAEDLSP